MQPQSRPVPRTVGAPQGHAGPQTPRNTHAAPAPHGTSPANGPKVKVSLSHSKEYMVLNDDCGSRITVHINLLKKVLGVPYTPRKAHDVPDASKMSE